MLMKKLLISILALFLAAASIETSAQKHKARVAKRRTTSMKQRQPDKALPSATIPFMLRGHMFLDATVNDKYRCNVIFDTGGADMFGIDSVYLATSQWKLQNIGTAKAGGGAGSTQVRVILEPTAVKTGNHVEKFGYVPIFNLRDVIDRHVDGILGIKDIMKYPLEINFQNHYIKTHTGSTPCIDGYMKMPIVYSKTRILLQAETIVDGTSIKGLYLMDTGSPGSINFTAATTSNFNLNCTPGKKVYYDCTQFGIGSKDVETVVDIKSKHIIVGNDTITGKVVSYIPEGTGAFSDREYLGVIGNNIWSKYNIIIDANAGFMYLKRFKPDKENRDESYGYNFRNRTDIGKGWIVSSLERGGAAATAGLQLNDIILSVNGKKVENYTWDEEWEIDDLPSQDLVVTGQDGNTKLIHLEPINPWK